MPSLTPTRDAVEKLFAADATPLPDPYQEKVRELSTAFLRPAMLAIADDQDQERQDFFARRVIADALCSVVISLARSLQEDPVLQGSLGLQIVTQLSRDVLRGLFYDENIDEVASVEVEDQPQAGRA